MIKKMIYIFLSFILFIFARKNEFLSIQAIVS